MYTFLRINLLSCLFLSGAALLPLVVDAQCVGIPSVTSLGSNKFPVGLCAPVQANVTYNVTFTAPVPEGTLELVYDWGDGSMQEVVPWTPGGKTYAAARNHTFPQESDCEYYVTMAVRFNGKTCTSTSQIQKISSWRTDAFNGGSVSLISPTTKKDIHLICEGEDIAVVFNDQTNWNCNSRYQQGQSLIESPNTEYRWQQIVYNTPVLGNKIPNVRVEGVLMTGANGSDVVSGYQDPRGVFFMSAPVVVDDARRRPSLKIMAPGGFGPGFPKAGDVFSVTLRYWNFCNPYDDPEIPGPPADAFNGDHPPVEKTALIKVLAPPTALKTTGESVCIGTTPSAFSVSGVAAGNLVNWYRYVPNSNVPGQLIASGTSVSLAVTAHPEWKNNKTAGVLRVWATQRTNTTGATNCESPPILVTRTIREEVTVPEPLTAPPAEICNGQSFTVALPDPGTEAAGGSTKYTWVGSSGLLLSSSSTASATFAAAVSDFGSALFVDRTFSVNREYVSAPACGKTRTFTVRIYRAPNGGSISGESQVCETTRVGTISVNGYTGSIARWEVKKNNGEYLLYTGEPVAGTITPGTLQPGAYSFRALLRNGPCNEVYSNEQNVKVFSNPPAAYAGEDQFICSALQSASLNANFPDPGKGVWTYLSSVPAGLPAPAFAPNDPNTTVVIAAENAGVYTLRWTVTNGSCTSADDVVIDFGTNPTDPHAGADKAVCGSTSSLAGNVPLKGQGSWTIVRGPGGCSGNGCPVSLVSPTSATTDVKLRGPSFVYGEYTFRWTISSGGNNCFLKSDEVNVTFEEPVVITAQDITGVCLEYKDAAPIALSGTVQGPVVAAEWINVTGKGIVSAPATRTQDGLLTVQALYQPSAADYEKGEPVLLKLAASSASPSCLPEEKIIAINFERKPVAEPGKDIENICGPDVKLNAGSPPFGATGMWTATQPGVTFDNASDPHTMVRNLPLGETSLAWTVTSANGTCTSGPSYITLTRVALPEARDFVATECATEESSTTVRLANYETSVTSLPDDAHEITWYKNEGPPGGVAIIDPSSAQTGVADGQIYIARVRDLRTSCFADAKVTIKVRKLPAVMNAVITRCEEATGSNTVSAVDLHEASFTEAVTTEPNVLVKWYFSQADASADRFPITEPVMVHGQKEFFARVSYRDSPFCFATPRLNVVVNPQPAIKSILGKESVCQGTSSSFSNDLPVQVYQVMPIRGAKYFWEIPGDDSSGFKVFGGGGERDFYVLLQFPHVYSGKISVRVEMNGCSGPVIEKKIHVSPSPPKPLITGSSVLCENTSHVAFSVSPNNYPSSVYNWEIRKVSDGAVGGAYITEGQLTGNVLVNFGEEDVIISVRENNAECVSPIATKVIKVTDPPKAKLAVENLISCFMASDGVIKAEVSGGTAPYTEFRIVETNRLDADNDGIFSGLPQGSYSVRVVDSNGCVATTPPQILKQPAQVRVDRVAVLSDANGYNTSCRDAADGEVTVEFSGGTATADYTITLLKDKDMTGPLVLTGRDSVTFAGLRTGTYSIDVADSNGCTAIPSVAFIVSPPDLYAGLVGSDQVICSGDDPAALGELVPAQGGTENYEYEWQESRTGNVHNDSEWTTIPGETGISYDPPVLTTKNVLGEQRHYRRIVRSISWFKGAYQACAVKGKTGKVTITVNPVPQVELTTGAEEVCEGDAVALVLKLTTGKAPMTFDYATSAGEVLNQKGPVHTTITIADLRADESYALLRVRDANGCAVAQLPPPVEVRVIKVNPRFTVTKPSGECDGGDYIFTWPAEAGVDYRWEWGDGTITELKATELTEGENRLQHTFRARSAVKSTEYSVKLFAGRAGCLEKVATQPVLVSPAITLNILAGDTLLCSGESITFYNNSSGVDKGTWYYREQGRAEAMKAATSRGKNATFTFHNTTSSNPITHEVVFEAENNAGCKAVYVQPVVVYRSNAAAFTTDPVPAFETESVHVRIQNASEVADTRQFEYMWVYGEHGVSGSASATDPFDITYYSPGVKEISLNIINLRAQEAGKNCQSIFRKQITIPVNGLKAAFTATPYASCYPVTVQVHNTSTGADTFLWKVFRSGTLVTTSGLRFPAFRITEPGIYDVHLTASAAGTGQTDVAELKGIQVFDVPDAAFELRSHTLYVPDSRMETMNFSKGANEYEWNFGDGTTSDAHEPSHVYQKAGRYIVTLSASYDYGMVDSDGDAIADRQMVCYDSARREVVALQGGDLKIPNAFTPDSNGPNGGHTSNGGFNDVFLPAAKGVVEFQMQIYDRWGTLVFESNNQDKGWDGYDRAGRLMPAGVYIYKLRVRTSGGDTVTRAGDVALIR